MKRSVSWLFLLSTLALAAPSHAQLVEDPGVGSGVSGPADADRIRLEIEGARDDLQYRMGRARRGLSKMGLAESDLKSATSALDRSIRDLQSTFGSLETARELRDAQQALERLAKQARTEAAKLRERAHSRTREALDAAADELEALAKSLDEAAHDLGDEIRKRQAKTVEPTPEKKTAQTESKATPETAKESSDHTKKDDEDEVASQIYRSDEVRFAGDVVVLDGESVGDIVALGGDIRVSGEVRGDAVAIGGNVYVGETGIVRGDAVAVGGLVRIQPGGQVLGQRKSVVGDVTIGGTPF